MKTLRNTICTYSVVLLASLGLTTTVSKAGSSDFAGIFAAVSASVNGGSVDGSYTDNDGERSRGSVGGFIPVGSFEAGVNVPIGSVLFITAGGHTTPGAATLAYGEDNNTQNGNGNLRIKVSDAHTWYIAPSVSLWDNSAIYVKYGKTAANMTTHDKTVAGTSDEKIIGDTYAVGTITQSNSGLFVKTEAGATQYQQFIITGIGPDDATKGASTGKAEGNPLLAYGRVSIGFKF